MPRGIKGCFEVEENLFLDWKRTMQWSGRLAAGRRERAEVSSEQ